MSPSERTELARHLWGVDRPIFGVPAFWATCAWCRRQIVGVEARFRSGLWAHVGCLLAAEWWLREHAR